jgi:hypothetical protein
MPTFQPPTDNFHALSDFDVNLPNSPSVRRAYNLLRHYQALPKGRNIFLLSSGTYTENEPSDMSTVITTYYGGHVYEITDSEAASLTAAGYGSYIS